MLNLSALFPAPICLLCNAATDNHKSCLCTACINDLPYIQQAHCCSRCGQSLPDKASICGSCQNNPPAYDETISLCHYDVPLDHLIKILKFNANILPADILGKLMAKNIESRTSNMPEAIIPIPLHPKRLRQRGYNQALELAKPIARQLNIPIISNSLIRQKHNKPQTECNSKQERLKNLRNSFACQAPIPYQHIALIDDVITTGTTANEAARVLKKHGVSMIQVWACGQTPASK